MFSTFMVAYYSGQMQTTVYINHYGESNIELIYLIVTLPFAIMLFYGILKQHGEVEDGRKRKEPCERRIKGGVPLVKT